MDGPTRKMDPQGLQTVTEQEGRILTGRSTGALSRGMFCVVRGSVNYSTYFSVMSRKSVFLQCGNRERDRVCVKKKYIQVQRASTTNASPYTIQMGDLSLQDVADATYMHLPTQRDSWIGIPCPK
jgi:hypothetical protein